MAGCVNCSSGGVRKTTSQACPPSSVPLNNPNCKDCGSDNGCCTLLETIGLECDQLQGTDTLLVGIDPNTCEPVTVPIDQIPGATVEVLAANNVSQPSNPQGIVVTESPANTFNVALNEANVRGLFQTSAIYRITATPTGAPTYFSYTVLPIWVSNDSVDVINPTPTITTLWQIGGLSPVGLGDSPVFVLSNITNTNINNASYIGATVNTLGMPLLLEGKFFEGLFTAQVFTEIVRATADSQVSSNQRGEVMVGLGAYGGGVYGGVPYFSFTEPLSTLAPSLRALNPDIAFNQTLPQGAEWFKNFLFSDLNDPANVFVTNALTFDVHVFVTI